MTRAAILRGHAFLLLGMGLLLSLPLAFATAPWGSSTLLVLGGGLLLHWTAHQRFKDPGLGWLLWSCLAVRAGLSVALYLISLWGLPVLLSLQLGNGFWMFAPDATGHHKAAVWILDAWRAGTDVPRGLGWYHFLLAALYAVMGIHPVPAILLNAVLGGASALLAYALTRQLRGAEAGRLAAACIAFWPSTVMWSTQLLKEQITICCVLLAFWCAVHLSRRLMSGVRGPGGLRHAWPWVAGLTATVYALAIVRQVYAIVLSASAAASFGVWAGACLWRRRWTHALILGATVAAMGWGTKMGRVADLYAWFSEQPGVFLRRMPGLAMETPSMRVPPAPELSAGGSPSRMTARALAMGRRSRSDETLPPRSPWLQTLHTIRYGQLSAAGHSRIYPDADISSLPKAAQYLPKGLAVTFLAPFPWEAFQRSAPGNTGALKSFSAVESLLLYLLFPFAVVGSWKSVRAGEATGVFLCLYLCLGAGILALTMVNLGSLFRYRVPFFVAVPMLACLGGLPEFLKARQPRRTTP